jgi:DNA replication protein DnaC
MNENTNTARFCSCRKAKQYKNLYKNAGITKAFSHKTFDNFIVDKKPTIVKKTKDIVYKFAKGFDFKQSLAILGQVGSGKTHLCIAVSNELLKKNIGVLYMQYRESITQLKQCITDEQTYKTELNKYRTAPVLYIDDLFKGIEKQGHINDSEMRIMFEIINYRYINELPVLVSSEYNSMTLIQFDEAVGSRIIEMCKGFVIELKGIELNHRLSG